MKENSNQIGATTEYGIETMTNEELVNLIQADSNDTEAAYGQLFINLRSVILDEAQMYSCLFMSLV